MVCKIAVHEYTIDMRAVLLQSLLKNKLEGVTKGFLVYLRISGIGYRASLTDQTLTFKLGYSHDIAYELPPAMRAFLPEPTLIGLYGIDKNQVGAAGLVRVSQEEAPVLTNLSASHTHSCHNAKNSCFLHIQALVDCRSTACLSIVSNFITQGPFSSLVSQVWLPCR